MTQKDIVRKVELYQRLLSLDHYDLCCSFFHTEDDLDGAAEIQYMRDYPRAEIRFAKDSYKKWDDELAQKIVLHELMHLVLGPLAIIGRETAETHLSQDSAKIICKWINREDESAVARLTDAIIAALNG